MGFWTVKIKARGPPSAWLRVFVAKIDTFGIDFIRLAFSKAALLTPSTPDLDSARTVR